MLTYVWARPGTPSAVDNRRTRPRRRRRRSRATSRRRRSSGIVNRMTAIRRLRPEGLVSSPAFSHVAVVPPGATTIYVGGQNAVDEQGTLVGGGDVAAQATRALANARTALAAAGATLDDVVQWTVLLVDGVDIGTAYGAIARELASQEPPLVTAALVSGLGVRGALVEIGAIAAVVR